MGRGLAAHRQAAGLGTAHQRHALGGRNVAHVVAAAGLRRQLDVALHLSPLALGRNALVAVRTAVFAVMNVAAAEELLRLAVGHDRLADGRRTAHGLLHEGTLLHAASVVREGDRQRSQRLEIDQFAAPLLAARDGGIGQRAHRGVEADRLQLDGQVLRRVGRGREVGHGAHHGVAAVRGGGGTRRHGLLRRESRLAQVDVHVHQSGQHAEPPAIDHARPGRHGHAAHGRDTALFHQHVRLRERTVAPYATSAEQ